MKRLVWDPIDVPLLVASVSGPGLGASTTFVGSVRSGPDDGPVLAIEYTAYEEMAEAELGRVVAEAKDRWPEVELVAQHRLGRIAVGDASVAVVAGAPHRADAFDACRYVMEEIKNRVPIWKKELFDDGAERWREDAKGKG
jgi:molybdopterin synthase catalytic subunit